MKKQATAGAASAEVLRTCDSTNERMAANVIHLSDTHLGGSRNFVLASDEDRDDFADALWEIIGHAARRSLPNSRESIDALVHTGDLFENHDPSRQVVEEAVAAFDHLNQPEEGIEVPIFLVHGDHDHKGGSTPGIDTVCKETHAQRLGAKPVVLNNQLAVYGIHHEEIVKQGPAKAAQQLRPVPADDLNTLLCTHAMHPEWNCPGKPNEIRFSSLRENAPFNPSVIAAGDVHKRDKWETPHLGDSADDRSICLYAGATLRHRREDATRGYEPSAWWLEFEGDSFRRKTLTIEDPVREYHKLSVKLEADDTVETVSDQVFDKVEPPLDGEVIRIELSGKPAVDPDEVEDYFESRGAFQVTAWRSMNAIVKSLQG